MSEIKFAHSEPAFPGLPGESPDSGLIILCRHLASLGHARAAVSAHYQERGANAPEAVLDTLGGSGDELLATVVEIPASTLEGVMARAAALAAYAPDELEPWGPGNIGTAHALARAVIRDLVAFAGDVGRQPCQQQGTARA